MNLPEMKVPESVKQFGLVGERKAIALLCLGFYAVLFGLLGLIAKGQIPEWMPCFFGLAGCYAIGFFALAADWFWGRWYAVGLGYSGLTMAIWSLVATRQVVLQMVVFGVTHGLIALTLLGERMAAVYEAKPEWRQRWKLDDQGVLKVRRAVTRAASSLPSIIMFALAPRDGASVALLALGTVGLVGLLRGRTWGVVVLATTGVAAIASSLVGTAPTVTALELVPFSIASLGAIGGALMVSAAAPFLPAMLSYVTRRAH